MEFPRAQQLNGPVLSVRGVTFAYDDAIIFDDLNFSVSLNSRISIAAPEGGGKSSLVKLLMGKLEPQAGEIRRHPQLRIGWLTCSGSIQELLSQPYDILLLDEPTRGRSAEWVSRLKTAIRNFNGGVVVLAIPGALNLHRSPSLSLIDDGWAQWYIDKSCFEFGTDRHVKH